MGYGTQKRGASAAARDNTVVLSGAKKTGKAVQDPADRFVSEGPISRSPGHTGKNGQS